MPVGEGVSDEARRVINTTSMVGNDGPLVFGPRSGVKGGFGSRKASRCLDRRQRKEGPAATAGRIHAGAALPLPLEAPPLPGLGPVGRVSRSLGRDGSVATLRPLSLEQSDPIFHDPPQKKSGSDLADEQDLTPLSELGHSPLQVARRRRDPFAPRLIRPRAASRSLSGGCHRWPGSANPTSLGVESDRHPVAIRSGRRVPPGLRGGAGGRPGLRSPA